MLKVLYVIACAAPPAKNVRILVRAAQQQDWDTCVLTTPAANRFINQPELEELTGHPVRSNYKGPDEPDSLPQPDAVIVAPATVNTTIKWALGICDTLALGILVEGIGKKLPMVSLPFTNYAHAAHPAFEESIAKLRMWGVCILYGPEICPLHAPGTGTSHLDSFPWHLTLDALNKIV